MVLHGEETANTVKQLDNSRKTRGYSLMPNDLIALHLDHAKGFNPWVSIDLRERSEVFGGTYSIAFEVHHALVDEIRRNAEGDGADLWRDRSIKPTSGSGYVRAGAVEITESRLSNLKLNGSLFAFTYCIGLAALEE